MNIDKSIIDEIYKDLCNNREYKSLIKKFSNDLKQIYNDTTSIISNHYGKDNLYEMAFYKHKKFDDLDFTRALLETLMGVGVKYSRKMRYLRNRPSIYSVCDCRGRSSLSIDDLESKLGDKLSRGLIERTGISIIPHDDLIWIIIDVPDKLVDLVRSKLKNNNDTVVENVNNYDIATEGVVMDKVTEFLYRFRKVPKNLLFQHISVVDKFHKKEIETECLNRLMNDTAFERTLSDFATKLSKVSKDIQSTLPKDGKSKLGFQSVLPHAINEFNLVAESIREMLGGGYGKSLASAKFKPIYIENGELTVYGLCEFKQTKTMLELTQVCQLLENKFRLDKSIKFTVFNNDIIVEIKVPKEITSYIRSTIKDINPTMALESLDNVEEIANEGLLDVFKSKKGLKAINDKYSDIAQKLMKNKIINKIIKREMVSMDVISDIVYESLHFLLFNNEIMSRSSKIRNSRIKYKYPNGELIEDDKLIAEIESYKNDSDFVDTFEFEFSKLNKSTRLKYDYENLLYYIVKKDLDKEHNDYVGYDETIGRFYVNGILAKLDNKYPLIKGVLEKYLPISLRKFEEDIDIKEEDNGDIDLHYYLSEELSDELIKEIEAMNIDNVNEGYSLFEDEDNIVTESENIINELNILFYDITTESTSTEEADTITRLGNIRKTVESKKKSNSSISENTIDELHTLKKEAIRKGWKRAAKIAGGLIVIASSGITLKKAIDKKELRDARKEHGDDVVFVAKSKHVKNVNEGYSLFEDEEEFTVDSWLD